VIKRSGIPYLLLVLLVTAWLDDAAAAPTPVAPTDVLALQDNEYLPATACPRAQAPRRDDLPSCTVSSVLPAVAPHLFPDTPPPLLRHPPVGPSLLHLLMSLQR
jgi:hypothetical protein